MRHKKGNIIKGDIIKNKGKYSIKAITLGETSEWLRRLNKTT